jgi:ethanolamine ammonia-lyase small subunit
MTDIALPTDTVLDRPRHGSRLGTETATLVKAALLLQPQVPELRAHGLSDTEIVDTMVELLDAGLFELIQHGNQIGFIPTEKAWTTAGIVPPASGWEPRVKRRPRPRMFRP